MIARSIALVLWLSAVSAWGRSDTFRVPVDDVRILMVAAIDSPTGAASGLLSGKQADAITQHFKATSPILIDISTERRYQQPGCSRLKVTFTQEGLTLPGFTAPQRRTVDVGLNYCRDGKPPKSLV